MKTQLTKKKRVVTASYDRVSGYTVHVPTEVLDWLANQTSPTMVAEFLDLCNKVVRERRERMQKERLG